MAETKFTPGPWLNWETLEWLREPQKLLANTDDARLMAASPEMYEALHALCNIDDGNDPALWKYAELWERAHAALAKAAP